jgi:hypothetical protein
MTDDELRGLIRAAIQRQVGNTASAAQQSAAARPMPGELRRDAIGAVSSLSFAQYQLARADGDTMCIIEPAVRCNHCGFCKCHGH